MNERSVINLNEPIKAKPKLFINLDISFFSYLKKHLLHLLLSCKDSNTKHTIHGYLRKRTEETFTSQE